MMNDEWWAVSTVYCVLYDHVSSYFTVMYTDCTYTVYFKRSSTCEGGFWDQIEVSQINSKTLSVEGLCNMENKK